MVSKSGRAHVHLASDRNEEDTVPVHSTYNNVPQNETDFGSSVDYCPFATLLLSSE